MTKKLMEKIKFLIKRNFLVSFLGVVHDLGKFLRIRYPPVPTTSAIITKGNKILVVKLSYENGYEIPGGVLQRGEDFEQAIKREVFEETGLKGTSLKYFGAYKFHQKYYGANITYVAKATGNLRPSKEGAPMWVDPKRIVDQMVFEDNKQAVSDFLGNV